MVLCGAPWWRKFRVHTRTQPRENWLWIRSRSRPLLLGSWVQIDRREWMKKCQITNQHTKELDLKLNVSHFSCVKTTHQSCWRPGRNGSERKFQHYQRGNPRAHQRQEKRQGPELESCSPVPSQRTSRWGWSLFAFILVTTGGRKLKFNMLLIQKPSCFFWATHKLRYDI